SSRPATISPKPSSGSPRTGRARRSCRAAIRSASATPGSNRCSGGLPRCPRRAAYACIRDPRPCCPIGAGGGAARPAGSAGWPAALPALRRVRLHTRFPIVLPERVDRGLVALLERARVGVVIVLHANHPRELDDGVAGALGALRGAGVTLLNQSVLLRGVND